MMERHEDVKLKATTKEDKLLIIRHTPEPPGIK